MSSEPAQPSLCILVVDDHALVREAFTAMLRERFPNACVTPVGSSDEALMMARARFYNFALVDIELGDRSGLDLMADLRTLDPAPMVIAVSMHEEETFVSRTLKLGARAYVAKDAPPQELFEAIEHCLKGGTYISKDLARRLDDQRAAEEPGSAQPHEKLSNRELEVLIQLARGKTLKEVARALSLSASTVAVHKHNVARKTGLHSMVDLFKYCQSKGLV